jgi:hypothetical protein
MRSSVGEGRGGWGRGGSDRERWGYSPVLEKEMNIYNSKVRGGVGERDELEFKSSSGGKPSSFGRLVYLGNASF